MNKDGHYSAEELAVLTAKQIQMLAERLGYTISGDTKAELITSFLSAQATQEAADIAGADEDSSGDYDAEELAKLTIAEIKELAESLHYEISGSTKAALIASFLEAQEAASGGDDPEDPEENNG